MSVEQGLPLPVVQMGHVEKIVETAQNQPHVQQLVAQELAAAELQRANSQVQKTEVTEAGRKVDDRKKERRKGQQGGDGGRSQARDASGAETDGEEPDRQGMSPWAGHIVNVKI